MAHAEKCPICDGEGIRPPNDPYNELPNKDKKRRKWPKCHGCDGKGWVSVQDGPCYTIQPLGPLYGAPLGPTSSWVAGDTLDKNC